MDELKYANFGEPIKSQVTFESPRDDRLYVVKIAWNELMKMNYPNEVSFGSRCGHAAVGDFTAKSVTLKLEYLARAEEPRKYITGFLTFECFMKSVKICHSEEVTWEPLDNLLRCRVTEESLLEVMRMLTYSNIVFTVEQDPLNKSGVRW